MEDLTQPDPRPALPTVATATNSSVNTWQVGLWHEPKKTDPRFDGHGQALAAAVGKSLKADTSLFCVWEWDSRNHATERFLIINGQTWRPA